MALNKAKSQICFRHIEATNNTNYKNLSVCYKKSSLILHEQLLLKFLANNIKLSVFVFATRFELMFNREIGSTCIFFDNSIEDFIWQDFIKNSEVKD